MVATILVRRLTELIEAGTDRTNQSVDEFTLGEVKRLARTSESALTATYEVILARLKQPHAQIRLHALRFCDELFTRSKQFRLLVLGDLSQLLPLVVGHKPDTPLPAPAGAAAKLRKAALECVEQWNSQYGAVYGQIRAIYNYLKDTLHLPFPDLQGQAAVRAAEAAAQQVREQAELTEEYDKLRGSFPSAEADCETVITQLEHCCSLLSTRPQLGNAGEDALEWEDADAEGLATEGLAMYAAAPAAVQDETSASTADPAAVSKLQEISHTAYKDELPHLQAWLQVLVKVKLEGRADQAQREALKRRLLELRTRLTVLQPRVEALVASSQVAPEADPAGPPAHRTAAEPEAQRQPSEQPAQQPAEQEMSPAVRRVEAGQIVDDGPGPLPDRPGSASHPPEVKQEPQPTLGDVFGSSDDEDALAGQPSAAIQVQAVPSGLKQKLLAEAPTVPHGAHLAYWDSDKARMLVNARGVELSNHWGPVDAHTELPAERLAEFFGLRASYYKAPPAPAAAGVKAEPAAVPDTAVPVAAEAAAPPQPAPGSWEHGPVKLKKPQPRVTALFNPALGLPQSTPSWGDGSSPHQPPLPRQDPPPASKPGPVESEQETGEELATGSAQQQQQHGSRADFKNSVAQQWQGPGPAGSSHAPEALTRQQQRQRDRHHNAAVLGMLPHRSASEEQHQGKGGKRKAPKGTIRQRLAKKLLGPGGVTSAVAEISGVEHEITREREGNRW